MATADLILIFGVALVLVAVVTPVMRRVALAVDMVDHPAARKLHERPIPVLGGLALYAAVIGALLLLDRRSEIGQMIGILVGATWMSFWGFWDDRRSLPATVKLLAQCAAAALLIAVGIQVRLPLVPAWGDLALTVLWVIGVTNAFNLLDNMDGLSSGVGAVSAAYFLLLAVLSGQYLVGTFAAALLGACLGFLLYNFNPARIFMGDSGSLFLGFMMAALGIALRFPANVPWVTWMIPILVLGVPLFDTTLVTVSRLRRRLNPLKTPGKDHVSHRLERLGWTRREAVLLLYLCGCAMGGLAVFVSAATAAAAYAVVGLLAVASFVGIVYLERHGIGEGTGPQS